ncbi:unnamed protein product, partial [marine sediment metagenome]
MALIFSLFPILQGSIIIIHKKVVDKMNEEFAKILFIGLSNAGKTSIYKRCFEHASIKEIENLAPTKHVHKNQVNVDHVSKGMAIWDFGGQELYRQDYLE